MLLSEIFDQLEHGEFSKISVGGNVCGKGITSEQYPALVSHLNMALTELHKRFPLVVKSTTIQQYSTIGTYYLDSEYAISNADSSAPIKYLIDSDTDKFIDSVFKIESVHDEEGCTIPLDDETDDKSVFSPRYNAIQVPFPESTKAMHVQYRSNHKMISFIDLKPAQTVIDISHSMLNSLLLFMGHRAYVGMASVDGVSQSQAFLGKFEASIAKSTELAVVREDTLINTRLDDNGWV